MATFDILPTDDYFPVIFDLPDTGAINERFADVDYGSTILIMNLGTLFVVAVSMAANYLLYFCCHKCTGRRCDKWNSWLLEGLFWTSLVDYCMESYIEVAYAVVINAYDLNWTSWGCYFSNIFIIPFLGIVVGFPIWLAIFLYNNYDELRFQHVKDKFEPAFLHLEFFDKPNAIWQPVYFVVRRLIIVLASVVFRDHICF